MILVNPWTDLATRTKGLKRREFGVVRRFDVRFECNRWECTEGLFWRGHHVQDQGSLAGRDGWRITGLGGGHRPVRLFYTGRGCRGEKSADRVCGPSPGGRDT